MSEQTMWQLPPRTAYQFEVKLETGNEVSLAEMHPVAFPRADVIDSASAGPHVPYRWLRYEVDGTSKAPAPAPAAFVQDSSAPVAAADTLADLEKGEPPTDSIDLVVLSQSNGLKRSSLDEGTSASHREDIDARKDAKDASANGKHRTRRHKRSKSGKSRGAKFNKRDIPVAGRIFEKVDFNPDDFVPIMLPR